MFSSARWIRINIADTTAPENGRPVRSLLHIRQNRFSSRRPWSTDVLLTEYTEGYSQHMVTKKRIPNPWRTVARDRFHYAEPREG
jgi:hypothetical protein